MSHSDSESSDATQTHTSTSGKWKIDIHAFSSSTTKLATEIANRYESGQIVKAYCPNNKTLNNEAPWSKKTQRTLPGINPMHALMYEPCEMQDAKAEKAGDIYVKPTEVREALIAEVSEKHPQFMQDSIFTCVFSFLYFDIFDGFLRS